MFTLTANSIRKLPNWVSWLLVASLAVMLVPAAHAKKKKKEEAPAPAKTQGIDRSQIDTTKLVWPLPPDLPRIKFLSEHFGEAPKPAEAKPAKKKQGWMDRMAGVQHSAPSSGSRSTITIACSLPTPRSTRFPFSIRSSSWKPPSVGTI